MNEDMYSFNNQENIKLLAETLSKGKRCVFVTGAGLSVSSGITPYRYDPNAIWSNFIMDRGTRGCFKADPSSWWNNFWLRTHEKKEFMQARPNAGHKAITAILKRCPNCRVVTQNIDGLHEKAGLEPNRIVEVHGSLGKYKCVNQASWQKVKAGNVPKHKFDCPYSIERSIKLANLDQLALPGTSLDTGNLKIKIPTCPGCLEPIMPLTLLFDEKYQSHDQFGYHRAERWFQNAEAMIFVGTSFSVTVTEEAMKYALKNGIQLFSFNINHDPTMDSKSQYNMRWIIGKAEETLVELQDALGEAMRDHNGKLRMAAF